MNSTGKARSVCLGAGSGLTGAFMAIDHDTAPTLVGGPSDAIRCDETGGPYAAL